VDVAALPDDIARELARRSVDDDLVRVLRDVAGRVEMTISGEPGSGPLPLAPQPRSAVALQVRRHSLSFALDRAAATRLHDRHGWRLGEPDGDAVFVQVNTDDLLRPGIAALVAESVRVAFDQARTRKVTSPRRSSSRHPAPRHAAAKGRSARRTPPQRGDVCPVHFVERSVSGSCPMCDE
jgi:hypothetical protein